MMEETGKKTWEGLFQSLELPDQQTFTPQFFRLGTSSGSSEMESLIRHRRPVFHDELASQLKELFKIRQPQKRLTGTELNEQYESWCLQNDPATYGVYVHYPWSNRLVHLVDEEEFVELRTSRNKYKITEEEQASLAEKVIGVIGLSVGQSVALTLATERVFGTLRIADFDILELTNLNRIRSGTHNLGLSKTTLVAREIAEIDPFLKVEVFDEGITPENIDSFIGGSQPLDLLIEECDSLPIKILARVKARALKIPVLMDTSDRGMIDIERFDEEPERELLHGLVPGIENLKLDKLEESKRIDVLFKLVGGLNISPRLKASLIELTQTIGSWPQISSSVVLGGAITTDVARKILLGKKIESGRAYVDMDRIFMEKAASFEVKERPEALTADRVREVMNSLPFEPGLSLETGLAEKAIDHASWAPSSGNDQPWLFCYHNGAIGVFHNRHRSYSFGDFQNTASYQSIGAAIENLRLFLLSEEIETTVEYFPKRDDDQLVALLTFGESCPADNMVDEWVKAIPKRTTNRQVTRRQEIDFHLYKKLTEAASYLPGTEVKWITSPDELLEQGKILAECDKVRVFNQWGHSDFFHREMRWTAEEALQKADGIDIRTLEIEPQDIAALKILREYEVVKTLESIDGGNGLNNISIDAAISASAFGMILRPAFQKEEFVKGGQAWERLWLQATCDGLSVHPLIAPLYLFPRLKHGGTQELSDSAINKLKKARRQFEKLWEIPEDSEKAEVFLFRLFKTDHLPVRSLRLPSEKIFVR